MFHIEIGPFVFRAKREGNPVTDRVAFQAVTPWFDVENHFELDRSKYVQMCVVCAKTSRDCECGDLQVLVHPSEAQSHLIALDHELYHHMTDTECGGEEDG